MIEGAGDIDPSWLAADANVAITAGASTPEVLVEDVIERLRKLGVRTVSTIDGVHETTTCRLPVELTRPRVAELEGTD